MIGGERASWDEALDLVARALRATRSPSTARTAVAFYVSGQLLTEDYYVANKLMKGFIGTANIDTNSRLCMASAVAGHKPAFGADVVPGCYEDLEHADLVVLRRLQHRLVPSGPVTGACRRREARAARSIVVIDPRRTDTAEVADLHLRARARQPTCALFNGLLAHLDRAAARSTGPSSPRTSTGFDDV